MGNPLFVFSSYPEGLYNITMRNTPRRVQFEPLKERWQMPEGVKLVDCGSRYASPFRVTRDGVLRWRVTWTSTGLGRDREPPTELFGRSILVETEHKASARAVELFRSWITAPEQADLIELVQRELRGVIWRALA
jgi:hypothetical protein